MAEGIYVVAYKDQARGCAEDLIRTIRKHMPGMPVCLASDEPLGCEDVCVQSRQRDNGARWQKTRAWWMAPEEWERVLYLDADILLAKSVQPLFDTLADGWDMVMTTSPPQSPSMRDAQRSQYAAENRHTRETLGSDKFPQLAGGVWGFARNAETERFLTALHREWLRYGNRDQQAMNRALYSNPVRIWLLGREFNWFMHHEGPTNEVHVMHFATAARAWVVKHKGRSLWKEWRRRV